MIEAILKNKEDKEFYRVQLPSEEDFTSFLQARISSGNTWGLRVEGWYAEAPGIDISLATDSREVNGIDGSTITEYFLPAEFTVEITDITDEVNSTRIRNERDAKLKATDHTQLPDYPSEEKEAYRLYREYLREIPQQETFPTEEVMEFEEFKEILE